MNLNKTSTIILATILLIAGCNNQDMFWKKKKQVDPTETRWMFKKELSSAEREVYENASIKIDQWWKSFEKNHARISGYFEKGIEFNIPKFMDENLQNIHPGIFWEFGPAVDVSGHRLVLTPESNKHLRPLVKEILDRAPKIGNWEFYGYRLPESFNTAQLTVEGRTGGTLEDLQFQIDINEFNTIDLLFIRDGLTNIDQAFKDALVAVETILGEEHLDKWVGAIEVEGNKKGDGEVYSIEKLGEQFDKKLHEIKYHQFEEKYFEISNNSEWTLFELKPKKASDYIRQTDMFVGKAMNTTLWRTAHSNSLFYSERYSKYGEVFCYLKIDGSEKKDDEKFDDKAAIEEALDTVLIEQKLGCVIGGGTGLRYSYIDLALTDLDQGISKVKSVLREANITKNSWILFYDTDLESEWVGIWNETPRPLMPNFNE